MHFGCNAHGNRPVRGSNANKNDRGSGRLTKREPNHYRSPDRSRRPHTGGDEDPGERKNPSGGVKHLDGGPDHPDVSRDAPLQAYQAPDSGGKGQGVIALPLDGTRELGRHPADIAKGGLIPTEGSPIVNALLARHTTLDRPTWTTPGSACHVVSRRRGVGRRGRVIQANAGGVCRPDPDRSTEVSGKRPM